MGSKNRQLELARTVIRVGEGVKLDVIRQVMPNVSGHTSTVFSADFSAAPVPDRKYAADIVGVEEDGATIKLLFAQTRVGSKTLRSLVVVHMSQSGISQFVTQANEMVNPTFEEIGERVGFGAEALATIDEEPDQTVAFRANFILPAMSGFETCLDFYHVSPFAIRALDRANKLAVDPVVRVDFRSSLLLGLVAKLRDLQKRFPPAVKEAPP